MFYVIGSGPAGVACASALITAGCKVTLLDAGLTLEPEREQRRLHMAGMSPDEWSREDKIASSSVSVANGGLGLKLSHGSDYPYRPMPGETNIDYGDLGIRASFAKGGLSNVWGAALLPFLPRDTQDWPVKASELEDAHAAVLSMLPVAGVRDGLAHLFPLPIEKLHSPKLCTQIEGFLADLSRHRDWLAREGAAFGTARVGIKLSGDLISASCNYCGRCLQGCPRDLIYSSRHTLADLLDSGKLTYIPGVVVDQISEDGNQAIIYGVRHGERVSFAGERAFLAAGVLSSTAILLRSLGWVDRPVDILDSQYFIFPLLRFRGVPNVLGERLFTLSQLFFEIFHEAVSPHMVHLQFYGFSDVVAEMLRYKLGVIYRLIPRNPILSRLLIAQGFLHSSHSGRISAQLRRQNSGFKLGLHAITNPDTSDRVSRVIRYLRRISPTLRALPLGSLVQMAQPGRSYHFGGSFPMAQSPREGQTDTLGRPWGRQRTHVVDATVFPSIPATTITQTIMANAFRIGTLSAHIDSKVDKW